MSDLGKHIATGLFAVFAGSFLSISAQAEEGHGHGPVPFSVFDMDQNGSISEAEFYSVREQRMAAMASEGKKMPCAADAPSFADLDTDADGGLSPDELSAGQKAHMGKCNAMGHGEGQGEAMKHQRPAFSDFDVDADGFISESEFNEGHAKRMADMAAQGHQMKHAGERPGFADIDTDADGQVSEQEFSAHQAAHHQKMQESKQEQD
jgi:Ca2+-binding EF-hand superfamily protein